MRKGLRVLVVDFGGQYTHLIARRCRELGVYSEIVEPEAAETEIKLGDVGGVILSGGPRSVFDPDSPSLDLKPILEKGIPILGICYGHQLLAKLLGGRLERGGFREYGRTLIRVLERDDLLDGLPETFNAWMSHGDTVVEPPPSFKITSMSKGEAITSMSDERRRIYSTQFHPEVVHTEHGKKILRNFLEKVCGIEAWWNPGDRIKYLIDEIRRTIPEGERVICAVSGGVDSMTTAVLVSKAVGDRLYCIFVDHGLMRKGERESVERSLRGLGVKNLIIVDARKRFLEKLRGISDPEEKRRIIGEEFIKVFEEEASKIPGVRWLAQGTIYPDRIESGRASRKAALIKSHHNVGALPERMKLKLIEPLKDFYKDEVREIARRLGLPEEVVRRHPFPGPGLAVRIIGEVTEEKLEICREANAIVEEELRRSGLYDKVWQGFAVVCNDKWVGVMGDERVEGYIVIVRVVESVDGMTADWHKMDHEILERISSRITGEVPKVTMVAYAATSKPPSTIEPC
ncbi:MAG: GMP synthase (glutamine-hydrolyzing) [Thaumarchaeota archaeon]|nr:MAG: GMP synthase (glutamine-hydrolyzing) [Nitrososphaerota archaeon]